MLHTLPPVSVIIIGLNCENHIDACIQSVSQVNYPKDKIEILFIDGGSTDQSVQRAKQYKHVKTTVLEERFPTPGRARNVGANLAKYELIQYLDSDTELETNWLKHAAPIMKTARIAAVFGACQEKEEKKNIYHQIASLDWRLSKGEGNTTAFGGIVLIKKHILNEVGGYHSELIAGEDPELSFRIIDTGYTIQKLRTDMITHDINMTRFRHYAQRCYKTGYGFAQVGCLHQKRHPYYTKMIRIALRNSLLLICLGLCILFQSIWCLLLAMCIFFKNFLFSPSRPNLTRQENKLYNCHLDFVILPQFLGILRFFIGLGLRKPLRNRR